MKERNFFVIPFIMDSVIAMAFIVLNLFAQNLGATAFHLGLMGFTWGISYSTACVISGRMADKFPRKLLLTFALLVYSSVMISYIWCSTPRQIILLGLLNGLGCGFFWPVFETFLHDKTNSKGTKRRLGFFNIGWTMGLIFGSSVGGHAMRLGPRVIFGILSFIVLLNIIFILTRQLEDSKDQKHIQEPNIYESTPNIIGYLYLAWVANFLVYFVGGATMSIFPKIARIEAISDGQIGMILALINIGQGLTFFFLSKTAFWHYKFTPIIGFQAITIFGLFLLGISSNRIGYSFGMFFQGLGRGMAYTSSLYYGLSVSESKGANTGIHEMLIGLSLAFGPLFGGIIAQNISLKSTFYFCGLFLIIGSMFQIWMKEKIQVEKK